MNKIIIYQVLMKYTEEYHTDDGEIYAMIGGIDINKLAEEISEEIKKLDLEEEFTDLF